MKVSAAIAEILKREGVDIIFGYPAQRRARGGGRSRHPHRSSSARSAPAFTWPTPYVAADARASGWACSPCSTGRAPRTPTAAWPRPSRNRCRCWCCRGLCRAASPTSPDNYNASAQMRGTSPSRAEPITCPAETANVLRRAFTQLRNGRPRPVLVEMPWDVLGEEMPEPLDYRPVVRTRCAPDPDAIRDAAARCWSRPSGRSSTPARACIGPRPMPS